MVETLTGEIMATRMVGYERHRDRINCLAVASAHHHRGITAKVLHAGEDAFRAENKAVIAFYETINFASESIVNVGKRLEDDKPYRTD